MDGLTSSDSSMDDCNMLHAHNTATRTFVQIPLWTIVTDTMQGRRPGDYGSDSSMDDCNDLSIECARTCPMFRFLYGRL